MLTGRQVTRTGDQRPVTHGNEPPGWCPCDGVDAKPRGEQQLPPRHVWASLNVVLRSFSLAISACLLLAGSVFAAPPGAVITNRASVDYLNLGGQPTTVLSNEVSVVTAVVRSPSSVDFTRVVTSGSGTFQETVGPSACLQGGVPQTLADPTLLGGSTIDPTLAQEVSSTSAYNIGEVAFIRLVDSDQNLDYQVIDYATVLVSSAASGDSETIRLSETGPDTGVFSAYVPLGSGVAVPGDCVLQGVATTSITVSYTDPVDTTDTATANAELDPVQIVFESRTGTVVSGSTIEIVDAVTGLPAVVYGNDGISQFPSAIVSGGTATDSSGTSYVFGPGEYRFPVVPDGDYRLLVTPPPEYLAPSSASITELQSLPGAPFRLSPASFGNTFTKSGDLSIAIDIPLDPLSSSLFLQKQTLTTVASPGDFVRYELVLENGSATGIANAIRVVDQLPPGVRFVPGSVTLDGSPASDPVVSPDLRTLEFSIDTLAVSGRISIAYVVEIVGGKRGDEIVNLATAFAAGGLVSNESSAAIRITEDLFRTSATIIGRVLEADCSQETFREEQGVANIRVYLEDGRYAVTDEGGRYHFEGLPVGTHVAQLDTFSVPEYFDVIGCTETRGYAGRADSQFVNLSRGSMKRADFYLRRKPRPEGRIDIEMRHVGAATADQVGYELTLNGVGNVELDNISLVIVLPDGVSYLPGTMRLNEASAGEPHQVGPSLSMALDSRLGNWTSKIRFTATIGDDVHGELVSKALARFDTPMQAKQKTPIVETRMVREPAILENDGYVLDLKFAVLSDELAASDKLQLDGLVRDWQGVSKIRLSAIGHTDSQRIKPANRHLFADNYVLSRARAISAAQYIARALGIPDNDIQVEGRGPDDPVADNATSAGRQQNRRVELVMSGVRPTRPSFIEVTQASSGTRETATVGAIPGMQVKKARVEEPTAGMPASQIEPPLETLQRGYAMLLPEKGFSPAIAATKVSIQHEPGQSVELTLNGDPVNRMNFAGEATNIAGTVAVSRWAGVTLQDGANELRAVIRNADGSKAKGIRRTVHFTGGPIRAEVVDELSTLVADGKQNPILALRLFDRSGKPARAGVVGRFRVNAPFRSAWDEQNDRKNSLVEIGERSASYRVGADGIALIELAPTTQTGEVSVVLPFQNYREQELRAWLKPAQRDWILVGFAEGTAGYNTLSDNVVAAADAGNEDGYYDDGRVAFFAKGSIRGEYLLTLAYDSARDRSAARERFDTEVDPNAYYALYADVSEQRFDAASQRKLYVKLERSQFYALFGDFDTGLAVTDLARYQRRFNGFKSEYRGDSVGYTVFAADTDQSFSRDEIRGDGTSGLYRLSGAPIIANSDKVRIEVRDRFDSGVVLSTQNLTRFLDYNLDTLNGTLYFKQPVPSRDLNLNPVFIVAEYESIASGSEDLVAGGRGSLRFSDDAVEIGVTHINDSTTGADAELTGVDFRWQINDETQLKAEAADSSAVVSGVAQSGSAQGIELEHNGENVDVRAFVSEVDQGFGLGYQSEAEQGVRRLGVDARIKAGERFTVEGEAGWQQNLQTEAIRNLVRGQLRYERDDFTARGGVTHAEDKFDDGESKSSDLVELGFSQKVFDGKVLLRVSGSTAINEDANNVDYPTQLVFGADYRIAEGVDVVAEYEEAESRDVRSTMTRLGVRATPWSRAQINSFLTSESSEFGPRLFANLGLVQGFQLGEKWILDFGVDQSNTLVGSDARQFDTNRELSSGSLSEDFVSAFSGATYTSEFWSANGRVEMRDSDTEDRLSLLLGWYRQPGKGHGLSAAVTMFQAENNLGNELNQANLKLGWAYRMADSKWSFLDRIDLVFDRAATSDIEQESWRLINNFNANRRISAASQLSLQYAFKYVRSEFAGDAFTGYTDLIGIDYRHGFGDRWDAGINTSIYHSYQSKIFDYGLGIDVGYNLAQNMWVTLGYNVLGFEDKDFEQARYTAAGPFLRFSIKADQQFLKAIAGQR